MGLKVLSTVSLLMRKLFVRQLNEGRGRARSFLLTMKTLIFISKDSKVVLVRPGRFKVLIMFIIQLSVIILKLFGVLTFLIVLGELFVKGSSQLKRRVGIFLLRRRKRLSVITLNRRCRLVCAIFTLVSQGRQKLEYRWTRRRRTVTCRLTPVRPRISSVTLLQPRKTVRPTKTRLAKVVKARVPPGELPSGELPSVLVPGAS